MSDNEKSYCEANAFFAAANSGRGFISFYDKIFGGDNIIRRYLVKGGPGTGKSTLMRRIADAAECEKISVERYRCSSDPSSLDGIILNGCIAIIDATAPHSIDGELMGARDVLIDLGAFWNSDRLLDSISEIRALSDKKKHSYALAYRFLSSAMESDIASRELLIPYVDRKRLARIARRLTRNIGCGAGYECKIGLSKAIGMRGRTMLDGYFSVADRVVYIEEHYGIGYLVLCEICEEARNKGCKISVSYDPLNPDFPDAVFFEESNVLFAVCESRKKGSVSLRRAIDVSKLSKRERNALRLKSRSARRLSEALVIAAIDELKKAGDAHFALEKIYRDNMDFYALDEYTSPIIEQIIELAKKISL